MFLSGLLWQSTTSRPVAVSLWTAGMIAICLGPSIPALGQIDGGVFEATGADIVPRFFHAGGMLQHGVVMVSGGLGLELFPPSLYSLDEISFYDPTGGVFTSQFEPLNGSDPTWPVLLEARSSHTQTTLADGRVVIAGGNRWAEGTDPGSPFADVEIFDPQTGLVSAGPPMDVARAMHTATLLPDGRLVVAGGGGSWQVYTPGPDTWSTDYTLIHTRTAHAAVLLPDYGGVAGDHRVLLVGGAGSGPETIELLDPDDGSTVLLSSTLTVGVDDLGAALLLDGRVFIVGGQNTSTGDTVSNTYLLDPVADTIMPGPDVPNRQDGIADHQVARLGRYVVVLGGEQQLAGVDTVLDYAAIYDSEDELWHDDGAMFYFHDDFVSVPLPGCSLLLVDGGVSLFGQEVPSANCEVFTLTLGPVGDLNGDGDVGLSDLAILLSNYGTTSGMTYEDGDIDGDGDVDLSDLAQLLGHYGESCS